MQTWLPPMFLLALGAGLALVGWWARRDLFRHWTDPTQRGGTHGRGMLGAMLEIDRMFRPAVIHVQRVEEEAKSEQEQDGD